MSSEYSIIPLDKSHRKEFINIILTAFKEDPLFNRIMRGVASREKKQKKLRQLASFIINKALVCEDTVVGIESDGRLAAVEIVEGIPKVNLSYIIRCLRSVRLYLPLLVSMPLTSILLLLSFMSRRKDLVPGESIYYLEIVAVHPDFKGKGMGRYLVDYAVKLAHEDPASRGIGLETMNPHNRSLYEHLGFRSVMNIVVQDLPVYFFLSPKEGLTAL